MSGPDGPAAVFTPRPIASKAQQVGTLLASAPVVPMDMRAELGVEVIAAPVTGESGAFDLCTEAGGALTPASATYTSDDNTSYVPFGVYAAEKVNAQIGEEEATRRAVDQLALMASHHVEAEFSAGTLAAAGTWANDYLTKNPTVITNGTIDPVRALAEFEDAVIVTGLRRMLHVTPALATYWQHHGLLHRAGNLLLSALDTIVVAGSGYSAQSAASSDAFMTDVVTVYEGPLQTFTTEYPDVASGNTRVVIATRAYAVVHEAAFTVQKLTVGHCSTQDTCA